MTLVTDIRVFIWAQNKIYLYVPKINKILMLHFSWTYNCMAVVSPITFSYMFVEQTLIFKPII